MKEEKSTENVLDFKTWKLMIYSEMESIFYDVCLCKQRLYTDILKFSLCIHNIVKVAHHSNIFFMKQHSLKCSNF